MRERRNEESASSFSRRTMYRVGLGVLGLVLAVLGWTAQAQDRLSPSGEVRPVSALFAPGWIEEIRARLEQKHAILELEASPINGSAYHLRFRGSIAPAERAKDEGRRPEERVRTSVDQFLGENRDLFLPGLPETFAFWGRGITPPGRFAKARPCVATYEVRLDGVPVVHSTIKLLVSEEGVITEINGSILRITEESLAEIQQAVAQSRRLRKDDVMAILQDHRAKAGVSTDFIPPGTPSELRPKFMPSMGKLVYLEAPYVRWAVEGYWYGSGRWEYHVDGVTGEIIDESGPLRGPK